VSVLALQNPTDNEVVNNQRPLGATNGPNRHANMMSARRGKAEIAAASQRFRAAVTSHASHG
tara:strand:+ start:186 stop:371 length:186 start_codon:yes stop_codon:yes gene_type:complete